VLAAWRLEAPATISERGPTIAEGADTDYDTPTDLLSLIARHIRLHLLRQRCSHPDARLFCPDCGQPFDGASTSREPAS
jgi:hypothetical protein